jgi:hypothetical protein
MAALQLRRGLKANLPVEAAAGEPLIATDTKELYIGAGVGLPVYKISDLIFSDVAPAIVEGKLWLNTSTNLFYRVDAGSWVKCGGSDLTIATATDLGGVTALDTVVPSQLAVKTYVDNAVAGVVIPTEWPNSVLSIATDAPATPTTGDRYLVGVGVNAFVGKDNYLAEYDGAAWVFTAPTTGTFLSVDDDLTGLYYYGGTNWVKKTFEANTAGTGIDITGGVVSIKSDIVAADGSGGLTFIGGVLAIGVIDGGTF